jgi:hypothetical protein
MTRAATSRVGATHGGIGLGTVPIDLTVADQIRGMAGVAEVDPQVEVQFDAIANAGFGTPSPRWPEGTR